VPTPDPDGQVSTSDYATLAEAIAAVPENGTVVLASDLAPQEKITIDKPVEINLNGKTLTLPTVENNYGMIVKNSLTIHGNDGEVDSTGLYGIGLSTSMTGELVINGGTYVAPEGSSYLIGGFGGKVIVNDGDFTAPYCVINSFDGYSCAVEINGGTFKLDGTDSDPTAAPLLGINIAVKGGKFSQQLPEEYIAEGYMQVQSGAMWQVLKK
jgi:hypothetical protein